MNKIDLTLAVGASLLAGLVAGKLPDDAKVGVAGTLAGALIIFVTV